MNHVVVLGERHLRRILTAYFAPAGGPIEPPELGPIVPSDEVGGLHHRYVRRAA